MKRGRVSLEERREARRLAERIADPLADDAESAETPGAMPMAMARRPLRRFADPDQLADARLNGDAEWPL